MVADGVPDPAAFVAHPLCGIGAVLSSVPATGHLIPDPNSDGDIFEHASLIVVDDERPPLAVPPTRRSGMRNGITKANLRRFACTFRR